MRSIEEWVKDNSFNLDKEDSILSLIVKEKLLEMQQEINNATEEANSLDSHNESLLQEISDMRSEIDDLKVIREELMDKVLFLGMTS